MGEDRTTSGMSRHTVAEAADMLGITTGAVRNRLSRGTLRSTKQDGTVYVFLPTDMLRDAGRDTDDTPPGMPYPEPSALISEMVEEMRTEVHYLRDQLNQELERRSDEAERYQQIIAALTAANASLSERLRELEPPQEASESPETVEEAPDSAEPRPDATGAQEDVRRPWWRRVFGS